MPEGSINIFVFVNIVYTFSFFTFQDLFTNPYLCSSTVVSLVSSPTSFGTLCSLLSNDKNVQACDASKTS